MNFYAQTVDSALWSSRAFDDAEYDATEAYAAPPPTVTMTSTPPPTSLLVLVPPFAVPVLSAYFASPPAAIGSIGPSPIAAVGAAAVVAAAEVPADGARAWAAALLAAMPEVARVAVVCTRAGPTGGGDAEGEGLAVLGEGKVEGLSALKEPAMLDGVAGAVVCEAVFKEGVEVAAYVENVGGGGFGVDALERVAGAVDAELGVDVEEGDRKERETRSRKVVAKARQARNSYSLYT